MSDLRRTQKSYDGQSKFGFGSYPAARAKRRLHFQKIGGEKPISKDDLALVEKYIAEHGVTKCPPMTFSAHIPPL